MERKTKSEKFSFKNIFSNGKSISGFIAVLFLVVLFVFFGTSMVNQNADISRMEKQKEEISAKYEAQQKENKELQSVLDNENKDDYIEQKAREKGYVKPNEVVFYDYSASE